MGLWFTLPRPDRHGQSAGQPMPSKSFPSQPIAVHSSANWPALLLAMLLAATVPVLLAYHQPPSATLLNQCVAMALWGLVAAVVAPRLQPTRDSAPLLAALALVALAAAVSWLWGLLPRSLALQALGLLEGAMLMVLAGATATRGGTGGQAFVALTWGLLSAGAWPWLLATLVQAPGLLAERWLFFAQAKHPQNLYYQAVS